MVLEELNDYDRQRYREATRIIENYYGKELFREYRLEDFPNYKELRREQKRIVSGKNNKNNQSEQNGTRGIEENSRDNNGNAFSIVAKIYGNEVVEQFTREDFKSFREFKSERQRDFGRKNTENSQFDNRRERNKSENSRDGEAGLENSAFSIGEKLI